jgi:C4-dicarboxylate-specific signal transduction histidine kinase
MSKDYRILVVEDEPDSLFTISAVLQAEGFNVDATTSGEEALQHLHQQPADLVLLDLMMPGMDGYEVCQSIKGDEGLRDTPVIILSARTDRDSHVKGLELGADDYVDKPFYNEELLARINGRLRLRQLERELREHNEHLEKLVEERTAAWRKSQEQLIQAAKLSAIGELVAGVAHELNNPLTAVLGFSELLIRRLDDEVTRQWVERIAESGRRCQRIVQDLLTFARQREMRREPTAINPVIQQAMDISSRLAGTEVKVTLDLAEGLPSVLIDPYQIQQVLINLFNNAAQAMSAAHGGGELTVHSRLASQGQLLQIIVEDTGPGIPEDVLPCIFDPFFTTKPEGKGTGLGLSVSYGIAQEHGGCLRAENRPEGGARFVLELPTREQGATLE